MMKNLSRFIAYVLRHNPSSLGITLDKNGWANVDELIDGLIKSGRYIDCPLLEKIVREDEKGRYSLNGVWQSQDIPFDYVCEIINEK